MRKNNLIYHALFFIFFLSSFSLQALIFGIFATDRTRAELIKKVMEKEEGYDDKNLSDADFIKSVLERGGEIAYNLNWESTIDYENKLIKDVWIFRHEEFVPLMSVPFPEVIYDFGVYKGRSQKKRKEIARDLKKELVKIGIPFINPEEAMEAANNKLIFAKLMHNNGIPHPATRNFKNNSSLGKMLDKHDLLFIKPTLGSKGYGIIIVEKTHESPSLFGVITTSYYSIKYKVKDGKIWDEESKKFITKWKQVIHEDVPRRKVSQFVYEARKKLRTRSAECIIQQGIRPFRFADQQTDFRVNTQRGKHGILENSGFSMRVGGNLSQGGRPAQYLDVLKSLSDEGYNIEDLKYKIVMSVLDTHYALEKYAQEHFNPSIKIGDIGTDVVFTVTNNGELKYYIIEANHKNGYPSRYVKFHPEIDTLYGLPPALNHCLEMDEVHEQTLIEYARYLVSLLYR